VGSGYYAQLRKILLEQGCSFVRQGKGSHEIWQSPITQCRFPVATSIVSRNTANAILKQAGLNIKL
jgi:predicted RNA binding protein YcfA (HicA-like mRNA interferase family)